jgi:shikimate kinase / 3-dehydroquinate synthase
VDLVLVGLPGSGKSAIGRRLAHRHSAEFIDLDESIEREAGRPIPAIFEKEGEAGFRRRETVAVAALGIADPERRVRRVIATGGGTVVEPRNRWLLYRGRLAIWLDARPEALAQRLRRSRTVRPLIAGRDPIGTVRQLASSRERFYAAAHRVNALAEPAGVAGAIETLIAAGPPTGPTRLLDADTRIGRFVIGEGIAADGVADTLARLEAGRAIVASEPGAWSALGADLTARLGERGFAVELVEFPSGESAKRLSAVEEAGRALARLRVDRTEPLVAVGGGALGDSAGVLAALWLRGVPLVHVPTTLVAQIDSAIGGKTAVDLPEGKNLLGAFIQPAAVLIDIALLRSLPERQRRAALGEAVKMAVVGDERLFALLEASGAAVARGDRDVEASGVLAEVIERTMWAKVEIVLADEREEAGRTRWAPSAGGSAGGAGTAPSRPATATDGDPVPAPGRLALNLGHSAGHALEAAGGYEALLHGEAVAYGLRVACRLGVALGITPRDRAARTERLLDSVGLGLGRLPFSIDAVLGALEADKKHVAGRLNWVLPTATGVTIRSDVPPELVRDTIGGVLAAEENGALASGTAAR